MLGNKYTIPFHFHGTLSANGAGRFSVPRTTVLEGIQFSCAGATAATLDFGPASNADGLFDGVAVGQSGAVTRHDKASANGALYTDAANVEEIVLVPGTVYLFTVIHASAVGATVVFELRE